MVVDDASFYDLPAGPPPLLSPDQVRHLAFQGWLPLNLPDHLAQPLSHLSISASQFFDQSLDVKRNLYPAGGGTEKGYYRVQDEKEYLTYRHRVHADSELEQQACEVWQSTGNLLHRILCDLSRAGNYSTSAWTDLLDGSLQMPGDESRMDDVVSLMRLFRYYPTGGFAAEHVDLGLLTLCIGDSKGLQVLDRSQRPPQYIDTEGPVIVVGDTLRALMRNQVRAGLHRVVGNPEGRSSVVFALRPCLKHPIDLAAFGGTGVVETAELYHGIRDKKYNINATKDVRDRQREAQKSKRDVA